ncbi:hypothetical protein FOMPIDRAFT_1016617 [Fomitopsis schrenkii]|uniref:Uncharacterized protein n=1 Tax=Fomitopsis schrenkii TaxID=2126942 RepID=S8E6P3_FOMSC|nr:hypothetical protein FOMPIDRAFT_1016617 [Fomitopsis schrenkii]
MYIASITAAYLFEDVLGRMSFVLWTAPPPGDPPYPHVSEGQSAREFTSNDTIWFFDWNTCALGGVGGINVNESSTQTLAGFVRNARRLNGTATSSSLPPTRTSRPRARSASRAEAEERNLELEGAVIE